MDAGRRKSLGSYYTPDRVVDSLVRWAAREESDRLLDPACGDGRFLVAHANSVGVEHDPTATAIVHERAPGSLIHDGDFFAWASKTHERFECAAGNPPFIRYQRFTGDVRRRALRLCERHGARFSSLTSSWAPFIVATSSLLKRGGRMAFVVPAEIGHAPYAIPVLKYLADHFDVVQVVAVRRKLFTDLAEDCWLLYCEGFGGKTDQLYLTVLDAFDAAKLPPRQKTCIRVSEWEDWSHRLRPFVLPVAVRDLYRETTGSTQCTRLGNVARVSIGYVTGANDFFHMSPSAARKLGITPEFLRPAVRKGRFLKGKAITKSTVEAWRRRDEPILLLRIRPADRLPRSIRRYLDSPAGQAARKAYKCRVRSPWYVVPDVTTPQAFLSYMSGDGPALVANHAKCVATNSVHVVNISGDIGLKDLQQAWKHEFTRLSCEIEGHPLGGGMLKIEPGEAAKVAINRKPSFSAGDIELMNEGIETMRQWRHYG